MNQSPSTNAVQYQRYQRLLEYINTHFRQELKTADLELVSGYSYRNINRIFHAQQQETIGHCIKRLRLEKAAEYLKYSNTTISDIAQGVGYGDVAAFSKAFRKHFQCAPSNFRTGRSAMHPSRNTTPTADPPIPHSCPAFTLTTLPDVQILYLQHQGDYANVKALSRLWDDLIDFAQQRHLLTDATVYMAELLDDNDITDTLQCRYNAAIVLDAPLVLSSNSHFRQRCIPGGHYARFEHRGSHESSERTYEQIYAHWTTAIGLELDDRPTLEFYLSDEETTPPEEWVTEICIPVLPEPGAAQG